MYSIYQCFMAASILCAILGVVCIGYLIYMFVSDNNSEENNPLINRPGGGDYGSGGPPGGYGYNEQPQYNMGGGNQFGSQQRSMGTNLYPNNR